MTMATEVYVGITYVVPCSGTKLDHAAPAAELYLGQMFRHTYARAVECARLDEAEPGLGPARVLILSAKYGLITPDAIIEPYDLRMGDPGSATSADLADQAAALGIDWDGNGVYALLPKPYLRVLDEALRTLDVYVQDVYEATAGIGEQRRVNGLIAQPPTPPADLPQQTGPGPQIWIGADVSGLWWGLSVLVSYGRLRDTVTLPVASAPWVLDSRGFNEVREFGTWTITPERYAADVDRYAAEVGRLVWVAPQDWPACAPLLARTGLPEVEHQARTTWSVGHLRGLVSSTPVIPVLTGATAAGYLRHLDRYAAAGFDLHAEPVVGVGALVGRTPTEAAGIVRELHAAGLTNLHGFGVKGRALSLVGGLVASVDSAGWSDEARRRGGRCPHGLVEHETNCPRFAAEWAAAQRRRAATVDVQVMLPAVSAA